MKYIQASIFILASALFHESFGFLEKPLYPIVSFGFGEKGNGSTHLTPFLLNSRPRPGMGMDIGFDYLKSYFGASIEYSNYNGQECEGFGCEPRRSLHDDKTLIIDLTYGKSFSKKYFYSSARTGIGIVKFDEYPGNYYSDYEKHSSSINFPISLFIVPKIKSVGIGLKIFYDFTTYRNIFGFNFIVFYGKSH